MPHYKTIRVTEEVYNRILHNQAPGESLSATIARLMEERLALAGHAQAAIDELEKHLSRCD